MSLYFSFGWWLREGGAESSSKAVIRNSKLLCDKSRDAAKQNNMDNDYHCIMYLALCI